MLSLRRTAVACAVAVLALASFAPHARADAAADQLFLEGRALASQGRYAEACPKLEESYRIVAGIGTSFNLADCYEHLGKSATAWSWFRKTAAAAHLAGQSDRETAAQERADALAPKLCRLRIEAPRALEQLTITRDHESVGAPQWGVDVPVDPGPHEVTATIPGRAPWQANQRLDACPRVETVLVPSTIEGFSALPITLAPSATEQPAVPPLAPRKDEVPSPPSSPDGRRAGAFVAFGIAGGTAILGTVLGAFALVRKGDSSADCDANDACGSMGLAARADAVHAGNASTIAFGVALGAVAVGTILLVTAKPHAPPTIGAGGARVRF